ncbi:MAG: 50S ribosomal protein L3 [archaeon GB-1867-005]|nr:50S ribosomal protein L3 [Candidatus Culexmicrobium cathedralense]
MGHRRTNAPRRGSLGFRPRVRAASIVARIRSWPEVEEGPRLLAFAGYKVGMTHAVVVEDWPKAPLYGREVIKPVSIVETPPLYVCAVRAYKRTYDGLKALSEAWVEVPPKPLERVFTVPEKFNVDSALRRIESKLNEVSEFRLIVACQPQKAGIRKKKPEVFEVKIGGGSTEEQFEYAKKLLGSEVSIKDVFSEGQYVDVISVTKGKGFQGVIKRFGVKILPRWHKHRKGHRRIGSIGPAHPGVMWTIPRAGQLGFHQRTEYNKRILKIGESGDEITPKGGFMHYGLIRGQYVVLEGSVPGPTKRLIKLRYPIRPPENAPKTRPRVVYIHV